MFKEIHIQNFRGIKDLKINDFKQVNLFVGANNSGKTSVLEALYCCTHPKSPFDLLLTNSGRGLVTLGNKMGEVTDFNYNSLFYFLNTSTPIHLECESSVIGNVSFTVNPIVQPSILNTGLELSINGLQVIGTCNEKEFTAKYPDESFSNKPIINRVYIAPKTLLSEQEYDNLTKADKKAEIISLLQEMSPSILSFEALTKNFSILLKVKGLDKLIPLKAFGDGTNKLFNIACRLYGNELSQGSAIFIDEIENGLHYSSQDKLWNWLFKIAKEKNIQIFATTHSMDCVRSFVKASQNGAKADDEARLYKIKKRDDETFNINKYNSETLQVAVLEEELDIR